MKKIIIFFVFCTVFCATIKAQGGFSWENLQVKARLGYSIGGTAPIGFPATIRSVDAFRLTPSVMAGADVALPLNEKWGVSAGLRFENKAMEIEATTKAYRMEVTKGDQKIEGLFTGHIQQDVTEWMLTLPIMATYAVGRNVTLKAGPYASLLLSKDFSGIASDGYLRQQFGIAAGVDWQVHQHIGLSADLNWGLTGIFNRDFKTVEQTLYPIYGTIGFFYQF